TTTATPTATATIIVTPEPTPETIPSKEKQDYTGRSKRDFMVVILDKLYEKEKRGDDNFDGFYKPLVEQGVSLDDIKQGMHEINAALTSAESLYQKYDSTDNVYEQMKSKSGISDAELLLKMVSLVQG